MNGRGTFPTSSAPDRNCTSETHSFACCGRAIVPDCEWSRRPPKRLVTCCVNAPETIDLADLHGDGGRRRESGKRNLRHRRQRWVPPLRPVPDGARDEPGRLRAGLATAQTRETAEHIAARPGRVAGARDGPAAHAIPWATLWPRG